VEANTSRKKHLIGVCDESIYFNGGTTGCSTKQCHHRSIKCIMIKEMDTVRQIIADQFDLFISRLFSMNTKGTEQGYRAIRDAILV